MKVNLPIKKKRDRPKRKFMEVMNIDLKVVRQIEEDAKNREKSKRMIYCDNHKKKKAERRSMGQFSFSLTSA